MQNRTRLTSNEVMGIGITALCAATATAALAFFNKIVEKKLVTELAIQTVNLHHRDRNCMKFLTELQNRIYSPFPILFGRIVQSCDDLVTLRYNLKEDNMDVYTKSKARADGYVLLTRLTFNCNQIAKQSLKLLSDQEYVNTENLLKSITKCMEQHYEYIMHTTSD